MNETGLRSLPVYGLPDGTLGVLAEDLRKLGAIQDLTRELPQLGAPAFQYRIIAGNEIPADPKGKAHPPSANFWLSRKDGPQEEKASRERLIHVLDNDLERFTLHPSSEFQGLRFAAGERFLGRFGVDGRAAWSRSRTGRDGLLALEGVHEQAAAEDLLRRHLAIVRGARRAALVLPAFEATGTQLSDTLERDFAVTSERVLEGLAVGRASAGKRGLDVQRARKAQQELLDLEAALQDLVDKRTRVLLATRDGSGTEYRIRGTRSGRVLKVTVRADDTGQTRVAFESPGKDGSPAPEMLRLRLAFTAQGGAAFALNFSSFRTDWGVHGGMPGNPLVPDHHFHEGMPAAISRQFAPKDQEAAAKMWNSYVQERLVPRVAANPVSAHRGQARPSKSKTGPGGRSARAAAGMPADAQFPGMTNHSRRGGLGDTR